MTYVVLARKWRPKRFDDVVGQEHITRTLANAISQGRVAHGYLFCGPRGVGKTTTARILAKALNCEKGPTPTPCNECPACLDVDLGRSLDIIEVDGASTRGIDDVRELRENARYAPTSGRTKVYIIDEVHMLTREAFNALLKTLEEPPPHVVFVMATTEPFKVPATILSRCQRFDFARIHPREVAKRLAMIAEAEGFKVQPDALALLARRSQGGLRDALSTLDQVLGSADVEVTVERVNAVLGILGSDFYFTMTDHLISGDARGALQLLDQVYHAGADLGELVEELARHLRNVMILSIGPQMDPVLEDLGPAEVARVKEQAGRLPPAAAARLLESALRTINQARRGEHLRLHLEVGLVEMASLSRAVPLPEVVRRLDEIERRLAGGGGGGPAPGGGAAAGPGGASTTGDRNAAGPRSPHRAADTATPPADRRPVPGVPLPAGLKEPPALAGGGGQPGAAPSSEERGGAAGPPPVDLSFPEAWQQTTLEVKKRKMALGAFLIGSRCEGTDDEGRLVVEVDAEHAFFKTNLESDDNRRFIEGIIREVFGRTYRYVVLVGGAGASGSGSGASGAASSSSGTGASGAAAASRSGTAASGNRPATPAAPSSPGSASPASRGAPPAANAAPPAGDNGTTTAESPARRRSGEAPAPDAAGSTGHPGEVAESPASPGPAAAAYDESVQRVMELFDGEITT